MRTIDMRLRLPRVTGIVYAAILLFVWGCSSDGDNGGEDGSASGAGACTKGAQGCSCYGNGTCNAGLVCESNICTPVSNGGSGGGGVGGTANCPAGQLGCACYPNSTCNQGLVCSANLCVAEQSSSGSGSDPCPQGQRGCACFANGTCNVGLVCTNNSCVVEPSTGGTGGDTTCPQGQQGCACYANGTCNAGLICSLNSCVPDTGNGGAGGIIPTGGTGGIVPTGGTGGIIPTGGTGGTDCSPVEEANACNSWACGTEPVCGVFCGSCPGDDMCVDGQCITPCTSVECEIDPVTGVDCGSCPGTETCCDGQCTDLSSDRLNCGSCGYQCDAPYGDLDHNIDRYGASHCEDGACTPNLGECITEDDGYESCDDYCDSLGESCVVRGCLSFTWRSWRGPNSIRCEGFDNPDGSGSSCDEQLPWDEGAHEFIRCCCTDTH